MSCFSTEGIIMSESKTKIQYSIDPNNDNAISITCNGDVIFYDSGSRNQTFEYAELLDSLAKVVNIEVENISPKWKIDKGTHENYQSLISWMEDFSSKHKTDWRGADNPRDLTIGFVCTIHKLLVKTRMRGEMPEIFNTPEGREQFCEKLNQMCSEINPQNPSEIIQAIKLR